MKNLKKLKIIVNNNNMRDEEIIKLWKSGLNKYQVAKQYMREYNQRIKVIRYDRRHRHEKFMTKVEALRCVEKVILKYTRRHE